MKLNYFLVLTAAFFALTLSSCGDDNNNTANADTQGPQATPAPSSSPAPACSFAGKIYQGVEGQGGEPEPGCEGCGNNGTIQFEPNRRADIVWPGDDVIQQCTYRQRGQRLEFNCEYGDDEIFEITDNCKRLSNGTATYVAQ